MRAQFDLQLEELNREMITMGMLCETAVAKASKALLSCDGSIAADLSEQLVQINQKEREIESVCLRLLLHQQPVARDLRTVSSALKMVTDIQRVGDQSADIAEILGYGEITSVPEQLPLREMCTAVIHMVTDSINAFVKRDLQTAMAVVQYDDIVDDLFAQTRKTLIQLLHMPDANSEALVDLLMISKYYERIGDHAVNIAKWVLYSITGEILSEESILEAAETTETHAGKN